MRRGRRVCRDKRGDGERCPAVGIQMIYIDPYGCPAEGGSLSTSCLDE